MDKLFSYHQLGTGKYVGFNRISAYQFESHLKILQRNNLHKNPNYRILFDDGYKSVYDIAFPLMKKYGFKGLVFPVAAYIGKFNNWDITFGQMNKSLHLSEIQIRDLYLNGWDIGSHGMTHKAFTLMSYHELKNELIKSKSILENIINANVTKITPPFSSISKSIIKLIKDCNYTQIYYQPNFFEFREKNMIKRHTIYSIDSCVSLQRKLNNSIFELIKETIIHKCSRLTILFKEIL